MENILQLIQTWLGGGANNSILIIGIVGVVVLFLCNQKKPTPEVKARLQSRGESTAEAMEQFHAAHESTGGDFAAIDPSLIVNLFNSVARFWPLIRTVAKLFGIDLPDITVTPLPPVNQAKKAQ